MLFRSFILQAALTISIVLVGNTSFAGPREDARFFMVNLMGDGFWYRLRGVHGSYTIWYYEEILTEHGAQIVDQFRFRNLLPARTAQDIYDQHISFVENIVIDQYGPDRLSKIVEFFKTPTGVRMLSIAEEEGLFELNVWYRETHLEDWASYLELNDFTRYSAFNTSLTGEPFLVTRQKIQDIAYSTILTAPGFFEPSFDALLKIIETDGVVYFHNDFVREDTVNEIERLLAQ